MQMFSVRIIEVFQSFTTCMLYVCILIFLRHPISQRYSFQYFPSQNPVKYKNITPLLENHKVIILNLFVMVMMRSADFAENLGWLINFRNTFKVNAHLFDERSSEGHD
jgi:hypothetical protein